MSRQKQGPAQSSNQALLDAWSVAEESASVSVERVEAGDGVTFPVAGDKCSIHYRGMLQADGREFDSSYKREKPFTDNLCHTVRPFKLNVWVHAQNTTNPTTLGGVTIVV